MGADNLALNNDVTTLKSRKKENSWRIGLSSEESEQIGMVTGRL